MKDIFPVDCPDCGHTVYLRKSAITMRCPIADCGYVGVVPCLDDDDEDIEDLTEVFR